ncbi:MAG: hypothetical protein ACLQA5_02185 [Solirubrobacteraceae bacterium]
MAVGHAFDHVWQVPSRDWRGFLGFRLVGLGVLAIVGASIVATTAVVAIAADSLRVGATADHEGRHIALIS